MPLKEIEILKLLDNYKIEGIIKYYGYIRHNELIYLILDYVFPGQIFIFNDDLTYSCIIGTLDIKIKKEIC